MLQSRERAIDEVRAELNRRGRRMTPQRAAILEVLRMSKEHPTAESILGKVQRAIPKISLGTVYRNLQVLVEEGYALRLSASHGSHRYDGDISDHHHVVCVECGEVADIHLARDPAVLRSVERHTCFTVHSRQILFQGTCPGCRAGAGRD